MRTQVVRLRDRKRLSWQAIGEELGVSAGVARKLYDERKGEGAHAGLLPGKGGRLPAVPTPAKRSQ